MHTDAGNNCWLQPTICVAFAICIQWPRAPNYITMKIATLKISNQTKMALKPSEWHFEMEKHLPVVNHGSQWESPAVWLRPAVPQRKKSVFSHCQSTETMLKISNFHAFLKCPGHQEDFRSPKEQRGSESPALTGIKTQCTLMLCWSPAALCVFSTEQVRDGTGSGERVGGLPVPAIRHPSAINCESLSFWFLCKLICRSFSPHWLVLRAPSSSFHCWNSNSDHATFATEMCAQQFVVT